MLAVEEKDQIYGMQRIILHMTSPLWLKHSTHVPIHTVCYDHIQLSIVKMSIDQYFNSQVNLPIPSQAQLSPNVFKDVNQVVTAALES